MSQETEDTRTFYESCLFERHSLLRRLTDADERDRFEALFAVQSLPALNYLIDGLILCVRDSRSTQQLSDLHIAEKLQALLSDAVKLTPHPPHLDRVVIAIYWGLASGMPMPLTMIPILDDLSVRCGDLSVRRSIAASLDMMNKASGATPATPRRRPLTMSPIIPPSPVQKMGPAVSLTPEVVKAAEFNEPRSEERGAEMEMMEETAMEPVEA